MSISFTIQDVASLDNLWLAWRKARRGKRQRPDVEAFGWRVENHLLDLSRELREGTWKPGGYREFEIFEPKRRTIAAAPFRDRVVHHALCNLLAPALERSFLARSFSCQIGKGTTAARECCRQLTNRFSYVLKCDVSKFFPSIDHAILLEKLADRVCCKGVMTLIRQILESYRSDTGVQAACFPGDDLIAVAHRPRGLPIGNLTSQLWGNFYLDAMDHVVTCAMGHGAYLRYTDDFLLFSRDKSCLWQTRERIVDELARVRLRLSEPKSRLLACREGVPFCGFRFFPGLRPKVLGAAKRRFEARTSMLRRRGDLRALSTAVFAWYQYSLEGNSEGLRRAYANGRDNWRELRKVAAG